MSKLLNSVNKIWFQARGLCKFTRNPIWKAGNILPIQQVNISWYFCNIISSVLTDMKSKSFVSSQGDTVTGVENNTARSWNSHDNILAGKRRRAHVQAYSLLRTDWLTEPHFFLVTSTKVCGALVACLFIFNSCQSAWTCQFGDKPTWCLQVGVRFFICGVRAGSYRSVMFTSGVSVTGFINTMCVFSSCIGVTSNPVIFQIGGT